MNSIIKSIFLCVLMVSSLSIAHAGKKLSSDAYLNIIEKEIYGVKKDIAKIKKLLDSHLKVGSLMTKDLRGLKPSWYKTSDGVSTKAPYISSIRDINGVILTLPSYTRGVYTSGIDINMDMALINSIRNANKTLKANGLLGSAEARSYIETKSDQIKNLYLNEIFAEFDKVVSGNTMREDWYYYKKIAKDAGFYDKSIFGNADKINTLFTDELFEKYGKNRFIDSISQDIEYATHYRYLDLKFYVEVYKESFEIGKGLSKSDKYNQINKLKKMFGAKVSKGDATAKKVGKYVVYQDKRGNGLYKGSIGVNYKNYTGFWSQPIYQGRKKLDKLFGVLNKKIKRLNKRSKEYIKIVAAESVNKYKKVSSSGF